MTIVSDGTGFGLCFKLPLRNVGAVKKFGRVLLLAAGAILAMVAAVLLAVNLYVQSQGTQARIQQELTQRLGTTLHIRRISVTPWSGLKLTGITMPQEPGSIAGEFLKAETFRLRIRFLSLFEQRLVITEVSLVRPNVVWAQNASGKWRLPSTVIAPQASPPSITSAPPPSPPATSDAPAAAPQSSADAGATAPAMHETRAVPPKQATTTDTLMPVEPETAEPFTPEVRRVALKDGNFHFLDANGKPVATFERVNFNSNFRSGSALRGNATIGKISLRDRFFLEQLQSALRYDASSLDLTQITARCADGEINGDFKIDPADPGSPFNVTVNFHGVQADRVVTDAGGPAGMVQGRLEGKLAAVGKTSDADALSGAGEIYLRDGQVRQYSLLVAVGELLQLDELKQLRFNDARVKYHINPGVVTIDELLFTSANVRLSANGTVGFDGKLHLDSQLAINEKIRNHLFRGIRDNFQPIDEPGFSAVAFQVDGTVEKPKSNLMGKVVGGDLKGIGGLIDTFLGGGKTDRAKKKKPADNESSPPPDAAQPPADAAPVEPPASAPTP